MKKPLSTQEGLSYFCPEQEGKGRVTYNKSTQLFSYETYFLEEKKSWGMSVYFPLHGEEDIEISLENSNAVKGSFINSMAGSGRKQKREAAFFLQNLSYVMRAINNANKYCDTINGVGQCVVEKAVFDYVQDDKKISLTRILGDKSLVLDMAQLKDGKSYKTTIKYLAMQSEKTPIISLELFTSNCL
ncbi:hypothetical protein [Bacteriovorax sp. BSW11_IV]|uniref:hypothetical protein n=1 Tax=Bacteriovorax sp. BSW11_IV TaxID=1353529 RepID=UPI00041E0AC7|nr:hypothetical protein [Bacteriovorax sp. BSW11_IV]